VSKVSTRALTPSVRNSFKSKKAFLKAQPLHMNFIQTATNGQGGLRLL